MARAAPVSRRKRPFAVDLVRSSHLHLAQAGVDLRRAAPQVGGGCCGCWRRCPEPRPARRRRRVSVPRASPSKLAQLQHALAVSGITPCGPKTWSSALTASVSTCPASASMRPAAHWRGPASAAAWRRRPRCPATSQRAARALQPLVAACRLARLPASAASAPQRIQVLHQLARRAHQLRISAVASPPAPGARLVGQRRVGQHAAVGAQVGVADQAAHEREHAGGAQPVGVAARHVDQEAGVASAPSSMRRTRRSESPRTSASMPTTTPSESSATSTRRWWPRRRHGRTAGRRCAAHQQGHQQQQRVALASRWATAGAGWGFRHGRVRARAFNSSCRPARRPRPAGSP